MRFWQRPTCEQGQATVELAVLLPFVTILLLAVVQAGVLVGDRLATLDAARIGARAAALRPDQAAVDRAFREHGVDLHGGSMALSGDLRPGGMATITVQRPPTRLAVVGRVVGGMTITEKLVFRIEDPDAAPPP